ncbi:MAG: hypothetical protein ACYSWO_24050 [Planctomycetota bacterium]|jgi:hypothetical protein
MAKKNFKDVTGIKFADLIMPLVMGGIGSYSPAAGRGVGLGLQAFRTFQAGQAFSDEREEKKAWKEHAAQQAAEMQERAEQIQQGKIDPSQVATTGFYKERGPTMPVGGGEVEEAVKGPQQFTLFGDDTAEVAEGVDLDRGDEISGAMGAPQDLITESLLGRKRAQDAAARDIAVAQERQRFYEHAQFMTPGTGGYMSSQETAQRISNIEKVQNYHTLADQQAENTRERLQLEAEQIQMKHLNEKELLNLRKKYEQRFVPFLGPGGTKLTFDKDKGTWFSGKIEIEKDDWAQYDPMELLDAMANAQKEYYSLRKALVEGWISEDDPMYLNARATLLSFGQNVAPIIYKMGAEPISPNDIDSQLPFGPQGSDKKNKFLIE